MQDYCNNCDKSGHTFNNCRKPITSYGIIVFRKNEMNETEYLTVCRKHTFGYIDFMQYDYQALVRAQIAQIYADRHGGKGHARYARALVRDHIAYIRLHRQHFGI